VCAFVSQTALDGDDESASFGLITATDGAQVAIYTSKNASFRSMSVLKLHAFSFIYHYYPLLLRC
jgi:Na+-transporting methylmalonyl-CoA/oxaloacetate decarboxylase beta subunit